MSNNTNLDSNLSENEIEKEAEGLMEGFELVETIDQLEDLKKQLVQFYFPNRDIYYIGYVVDVKLNIRKRDEKEFVRMTLSQYTSRSGKNRTKPFDMRLYNQIRDKGKLDSGTMVHRMLSRKVEYKMM